MTGTETGDQPKLNIEPGNAGGDGDKGIELEAQSEGHSDSEIGGKDLPKELEPTRRELMRDYHKKMQALADERKTIEADAGRYRQDAEALYSLSQQQWFKDAVAAEKNKRGGKAEISDDDFEAIKSDKRAFQDFLNKRDKSLAEGLESKFKAEFENLTKEQQKFVTEKEFDGVVREYGQAFLDANEAGELEPYLEKDYDYETAFKLLMQDRGQVAKKASANGNGSEKTGITEKRGMPAPRGGPVAKAKNLNEALEAAFEMARRGQKDYKIERS